MLDASVKAREDAAAFDTSRLVEFSERLLWEGPVLALSPLVREPGRLAITDHRVYFQPLHNISGMLTATAAGMLLVWSGNSLQQAGRCSSSSNSI